MNNGVSCGVVTIEDIINHKLHLDGECIENVNLVVPQYQRSYAWKEDNVRQLIRDVRIAMNKNNPSYHLGTIILYHDQSIDKKYEIVDGQQRLKTLGFICNEDIISNARQNNENANKVINQIKDLFGDDNLRDKIVDFLKKCTLVCIVVSNIAEAFQLFDTQNGRGEPLSPVNLLKAFHFHEMNRPSDCGNPPTDKRIRELEVRWEDSNALRTCRGDRLLTHLLSEHIYRLRCWSRGEPLESWFNVQKIGEFKGLTIGAGDSLPLQNGALLRRLASIYAQTFGLALNDICARVGYNRRDPKGVDPFVSVTQSIVNGEDFFNYANTYVEMYRMLFTVRNEDNSEDTAGDNLGNDIKAFRDYYIKHCLYPKSYRTGDTYARHVFEALCIFCFDRYGIEGLKIAHECLYLLVYFDRYRQTRLYYESAGKTFALKCIKAMAKSETLVELKEELSALIKELKDKIKDPGVTYSFDENGACDWFERMKK